MSLRWKEGGLAVVVPLTGTSINFQYCIVTILAVSGENAMPDAIDVRRYGDTVRFTWNPTSSAYMDPGNRDWLLPLEEFRIPGIAPRYAATP